MQCGVEREWSSGNSILVLSSSEPPLPLCAARRQAVLWRGSSHIALLSFASRFLDPSSAQSIGCFHGSSLLRALFHHASLGLNAWPCSPRGSSALSTGWERLGHAFMCLC